MEQQGSSFDLHWLGWFLGSAWSLAGAAWPWMVLFTSWQLAGSVQVMWPQVSLHMVTWVCSHGDGDRAPESIKKKRLWCTTTFQISACITFFNVPLAKASRMAKPRNRPQREKWLSNIGERYRCTKGRNLWSFVCVLFSWCLVLPSSCKTL